MNIMEIINECIILATSTLLFYFTDFLSQDEKYLKRVIGYAMLAIIFSSMAFNFLVALYTTQARMRKCCTKKKRKTRLETLRTTTTTVGSFDWPTKK